jgi:hypothetical protein
VNFTLAFALELRKKHGKTSVRVAEEIQSIFRAEFRPHRCDYPSAFICRLLSVVCFHLFCILIFGEMRKIKYLILARVRYLICSSSEKILVNTGLEDVVKLCFDFGRLASKKIDGNGADNVLNLWKLPVLIKVC